MIQLMTFPILAALALPAPGSFGQDSLGSEARAAPDRARPRAPVLQAAPLRGEAPHIDGVLDDAAWARASVADGFVQLQPDEGESPSQRSEVRVLYGPDALYVAFRAHDSAPDSIAGQLTRRDQRGSYSDWVHVAIDSYRDRRTAFHFAVNPVGVKLDMYRYDDTQEDASWDAVWYVATSVDDEGWSAEFRIPYSQLRFRDAPEHTWGINFMREIARYQETSVWAPLSRQESAVVSRFGELQGIQGVQAPRRLEIQPYSMARVSRAPGDPANPFFRHTEGSGTVGADLKYGVTGNLTLDVTLNPDFGQVEADPAQVNLTAFETFLPEKRPFFIEGANIFRFGLAFGDGDNSAESLFYSRRVGRAPQGTVDTGGGWADADDQTTILGAWKLSGKTTAGWSLGFLHALTGEERARVATGAGERFETAVEPLTHYGVARVQRDFLGGQSALGAIGTVTNREPEVAHDLGLRSQAYTGGVDGRHRFGGGNYEVTGFLLGSHVRGSEETMAATQRSPSRYFQRPDAQHVELDSTRTSLGGWSGGGVVSRIGGGFWRFATGGLARSPGFEPNDVGFMRETDYVSPFLWVGYHHTRPNALFRQYFLNWNGWGGWTFGGERTNLGGNVNGSFQLHSRWGGWAGINRGLGGLSTGMLRGGPAFRTEDHLNGWFGFYSDSRKSLQLEWGSWFNTRAESDSWSYGTSPFLRWRPSGRTSTSAGVSVNRNVNDRQWVQRLTLDDEPHYVFGRLDQTTVGLTFRLDHAFSPVLSLQVYAQPFVSAGGYTDLKRVTDPRARRYADRFEALDVVERGDGSVRADVDGDGILDTLDEPDFGFKQFRSNAVLRWEYRPGSALFLVWSQGRDHFESQGGFGLGSGMDALFDRRPHNVFMIKVSYWLNP